jgi:hypothetical protein
MAVGNHKTNTECCAIINSVDDKVSSFLHFYTYIFLKLRVLPTRNVQFWWLLVARNYIFLLPQPLSYHKAIVTYIIIIYHSYYNSLNPLLLVSQSCSSSKMQQEASQRHQLIKQNKTSAASGRAPPIVACCDILYLSSIRFPHFKRDFFLLPLTTSIGRKKNAFFDGHFFLPYFNFIRLIWLHFLWLNDLGNLTFVYSSCHHYHTP